MTAFLALYKGETIGGARLVALTADTGLVRDFAVRLVADESDEERKPGLRLLERGHDDEEA